MDTHAIEKARKTLNSSVHGSASTVTLEDVTPFVSKITGKPLLRMLALAVKEVNANGFVPRRDSDSICTGDHVLAALLDNQTACAEDCLEAISIIDWIMHLDQNIVSTNPFYKRVRRVIGHTLWNGTNVTNDAVYMVTALVTSYRKFPELKERIDRSTFQGILGQLFECDTVNFHLIKMFENNGRTSYLYGWRDSCFNEFTWITTQVITAEVTHIKGIVKAHKTFMCVRQTILERCVVK